MFGTLKLENFTAFAAANLVWSQGVNVLVGENGTGKTHLLKLLYAFASYAGNVGQLERGLADIFLPLDGDLRQLIRDRAKQATVELDEAILTLGQPSARRKIPSHTATLAYQPPSAPWQGNGVFLPAKEVLSFAPGFVPIYEKYALAFDRTYYDLIRALYLPHQKRVAAPCQAVLDTLQQAMEGAVSVQGDTFLLNGRTMHLVAEGYRKLALLWQLLRNGTLSHGSVLFWDEPETNLNPSLMPVVVQSLLALADHGIQIFLTSHHDALLRELELQRQTTPVRFFALAKDKGGVLAQTAEHYAELSPNKMEEQYLRLYDLEIQRALGDA